jgi:uncharacterized protein (TIRG00374 family)
MSEAEDTGSGGHGPRVLPAWLVVLTKVLISAGLLALLVRQAAGNPTVRELLAQPKRWEWVVVGAGLVAGGYLLSFIRWWCLAWGVRLPLPLGTAVRWSLMSQPFQLISFGVAGGDLWRAYLLCREQPERKTHAVATVGLDRGIGLTVMFGAVAVIGSLLDWERLTQVDVARTTALRTVWWVSLSAFVAALVGAAAAGLGGERWVRSLGRWVPTQSLRDFTENLAGVVPLYRSRPTSIVAAIVLSLGNVVCLSLAVYCLAQSLTPATPSVIDHLLITPISLIAGAVPLPGGLGSQELVMSWLYAAFSTEQRSTDFGFLVAVGYRLATFVLIAIGWWLYVRSGSLPSRAS